MVEAELLASVRADDAFLTEVSSHLIVAGGKRVRPLFAVASAAARSAEPLVSDDAVRGGVAVELVHLGSLYHDDVIDEAVTRRTVESVNARWGNLTAILAGDFLLAKASEIAASLGSEVAGLLAATIGRLCEGEVGELRSAFDVDRTEASYLQSIRGKTAALFATACRIGALVGDLPRDAVDALTAYGEGYGVAFQIVDDVLDLVASEAELGKPTGHDLVEGVYTLPVLRALDAPGGLRERLGRPLDNVQLHEALSLVRADGAVDAALETARGYAARAVEALAPLDDNAATTWLASATDLLFARASTRSSPTAEWRRVFAVRLPRGAAVDTLTREPDVADVRDLDVLVPERPQRPQPGPAQVALAALSLCAAVIHAAFAPTHFSETWIYGAAFLAMAWYQVMLAILLLTRPKRWVYVLGLLNLGIIGIWVMSRTVGAPFGPTPWTKEDIGFPDVLSTDLEGFIVLGCLALLIGKAWRRNGRWTAMSTIGVASLGLVAAGLTTTSLTPRFTAGHTHGPASTAGFVLTGTTPCEKSGPPASDGSIKDADGHNHRGPTTQIPIDQATQEQLRLQQVQAASVAQRFPIVSAAEAAGYKQSTPFVPCIGAHYTNISLVPGFDPNKPSELLFDGTKPDSQIIGLSYLVLHPGGAPEGFAGPNDHWHQHNANGGLCFSKANGVVIGSEQLTPEQCAAISGVKRELPDIWMLHDWVVPGWACSWGVFAPECPELGGKPGAPDAWTG